MYRWLCTLLTVSVVATVGCSDSSNGKNTSAVPGSGGVPQPATQPDNARGTKTLQCWNSVTAIMNEEVKIISTSQDFVKVAPALRTAAKRVRQLPVLGIDPE